MGTKYKRYKNSLERFLASEKGKRYFNFFYSWGASIVIIGALFKINHWDYGTQILMVGMIVEAIIFFISAFDLPAREYKWDRIFPKLNRKPNAEDGVNETTDVEADSLVQSASEGYFPSGPAIMMTSKPSGRSGAISESAEQAESVSTGSVQGGVLLGGNIVVGGNSPIDPTEAAEIQDASEKYAEQLSKMANNMEKFAEVTESLTKVSDTLLNSFKSITDNSDGIESNTEGYVKQMENLNRNIAGLNTIYEIQLKGVSGQINTIEQINAGLDRIKYLYSGSLADSSIFKSETEKMAQQLTELNQVYARLLQAMTTNMNMNMGGGFSNNNPNPSK